MEAKGKLRMISKRIILINAIILFAGSVTAINVEQVNSLENNPSTILITVMFFALFLIYLAGSFINKNSVKPLKYRETQNREHHHYKKIIKKTA